jgi:adapter protein MecA 1/2
MEIERINENTVKFYISYMDIENRGFDREEIWYNREKSEQLFWDMMDEVNEEEEFIIDGPLWIQVHAMDKGLEILVTKAQLTKDGHKLEFSPEAGKLFNLPIDDKGEAFLGRNHFIPDALDNNMDDMEIIEDDMEDESFSIVIRFHDIEHVIQLSHSLNSANRFQNKLFHFESAYFLYIEFSNAEIDDEEQENILSHILEYGEESSLTYYRLAEYGKVIYAENALQSISNDFPLL